MSADEGAEHLVLVGMSAHEVALADRVAALAGDRPATVAFLQVGDPSLSRELTRLADLGAERVVLVGVRLGASGPGASWLRRVAGHWWRERSGHRPAITVAAQLLRHDGELPTVLGRAVRPVTGREADLASAAWQDVPGHRHQVLVCRGPRCTARGSEATAAALSRALVEHGQGDDDVLVTQTGCLFPCNHAPVVAVQPDDVWYGRVDDAAAALVVAHHLVAGAPVTEQRLPRRRGPSRGLGWPHTSRGDQEPGAGSDAEVRGGSATVSPLREQRAKPDTGHGTSADQGREPRGETR
ncbi:hypothetical protein NOK12_25280 [Nocardioides sp. OK12]|nr:hypothetical protein NOK12_25280 [Nocardioides sp. OK12]